MSHPKPRKVHVETVTRTHKGKVYKSVLLRRTYREDGKVKHETVGNLSDLPDDAVDYVRRRLAGESPMITDAESFRIVRSLPHGNVAAVLGTARNIGLDTLLVSRPCRERQLVMAMIVDRILSPGSKLSCIKGLQEETAQNTLADELRLGKVDVHELYKAMDWLLKKKAEREVSFLGLPRGLRELSRPSRTALLRHQASVPNGLPRRTQFLRAASSASV